MNKIHLLIGILALLFMVSCHTKEHEKHDDVFYVTSPIRMDTMTTREYVCQIRAIQHIELRALESGYLEKIFIDEGKYVKQGQLLFRILPIQYQAEMQKAVAEAQYAEIEYQNAQILADSNVISPVQLALVKAKFEKAKAELELARVHLGFMEIRAPFDGLVDRFTARQGSLLDDGDLLTTMSDISELWVYFNVPEAEYLDYKQSTSANKPMYVNLKMANHQMYKYTGEVKTIEADFNNETGTIAFRATFPNPEELLRHGETGNVIVTVPLKNVLVIPQKATFEVLDQKYVYVLDKNNVLKSRRITVSAEMPDLYIVTDGLGEDDRILLEGIRKVKENDKITYEFKEPRQVLSHLRIHAE